MENILSSYSSLAEFNYESKHSISNPFLIKSNKMGYGICPPDFFVQRKNDYPFLLIHFVLDGCGFFHVSGQDYLLHKGDAILISAYEEHLYKPLPFQEPLTFMWIELEHSVHSELFQYFKINNIHTVDSMHTEKPLATLAHIQQILRENSDPSPFELSILYYTLLVQLMESVSSQPQRELPALISETLAYINQNFTEDIHISSLSKKMHVSHTYLTRIFRQYIGTTPLSYINLKRLEYARQLLTETSLSCEKIAERVGFFDASHFHRMFRNQFGCAPSAYRKNNQ